MSRVRPWQSACRDPREQLEVDLLRQPPERAVADRRRATCENALGFR